MCVCVCVLWIFIVCRILNHAAESEFYNCRREVGYGRVEQNKMFQYELHVLLNKGNDIMPVIWRFMEWGKIIKKFNPKEERDRALKKWSFCPVVLAAERGVCTFSVLFLLTEIFIYHSNDWLNFNRMLFTIELNDSSLNLPEVASPAFSITFERISNIYIVSRHSYLRWNGLVGCFMWSLEVFSEGTGW